MLMNVSEMAAVSNATVAMAFYGSGASPGGRRVFVGAAVDVKSAGLRRRGLTYPPFIAQLKLRRQFLLRSGAVSCGGPSGSSFEFIFKHLAGRDVDHILPALLRKSVGYRTPHELPDVI
jgi:hypothetical protein